jgi:hypothetical protein
VVVAIQDHGVTVTPFDDTTSLVSVQLDQARTKVFANDQLVVLIGDKLFGLRDAPLRSQEGGKLQLVAPTALLRSTRHLSVGYPLCGKPAVADFTIAGDFTAAKLVRLGGSADGAATFAVTGNDLADKSGTYLTPKVNVYVVDPTKTTGPALAEKITPLALSTDALVFTVKKEFVPGLKQVAIVTVNGEGQPVLLALAAPSATLEVKAPAPILVGRARPLTLLGANFDTVESVLSAGKPLPAVRSLDNKSLTVDLPESVTRHVPSSILLLIGKDKSETPVIVTVVPEVGAN